MKPDIGGELLPAEFGRDPDADEGYFAEKLWRCFCLWRGSFLWRRKMRSGQGTADIGKLPILAVTPEIFSTAYGEKNGRENRPFAIVFRGVSPADGALGGTGRASLLHGRGFLLQRGLFQCRIYRDPAGAKRAERRRSLSDIVMIGLLQYTVGLFMITGDRGKMKAGAVLKHPEGCRGLLGAVICRKYSKTGACRFAVFHRWKHQHPACHAAVGSLSGKGQI